MLLWWRVQRSGNGMTRRKRRRRMTRAMMRTMSRQAAFSYLARQHPQQGPAVGSRATSAMTHPQPLGCTMHLRKHA